MPVEAKLLEHLKDKNTIVIIPEVGREHKAVTDWLKANAPDVIKTKRVYTELDMTSLRVGLNIMTVFHDPETPLMTYELDRNGTLQSMPRSAAELKDEMIVSQPVRLDEKDWTQDLDRPMRAGRLNTADFITRLCQACAPKRFDYADKGEKHPVIMKLVEL